MSASSQPPTPTSAPKSKLSTSAPTSSSASTPSRFTCRPLRERREDIPPLAAHFLSRYAQRYRKQVQSIDPAALQLMLHYAWPGNVRELDHTIERAVLMSREDIIEVSDLGLSPARVSTQALEEMSLESVESILIRKALSRCNGNVSQAAEALGLSRGALYRRMEKYGI
jgi:DNA-binding NtrC family response regulator